MKKTNFDFIDELYLFRHSVMICEKRLGDVLDHLISDVLASCHPENDKESFFIACRVCAMAERGFEDLCCSVFSSFDDGKEKELALDSDSENIKNLEFILHT